LHAIEHIHVGKRIARDRNQIGKGPGRDDAQDARLPACSATAHGAISNTAPAKANRFIAVPCANRG